ncbi:diguanylate phosphodiesterase [[Erwinia] mediterraneensis]|uniref:diguanylate phosphodiesterase n=1 Tax=[Erwinia] mediterraneensis TaxID=2161819 RepID=UPI00102FD9C1|nr:diguanylate phosphodiesterase [[Erwinia] mediterraneensis]
MLTTLLYRSHISEDVPVKILGGMVSRASQFNAEFDVTGILLFNGTHFFQLLEGPEAGVLAAYERICADQKHYNLVELMRDYAPSRRFGNAGMELFDLREHEKSSLLQAVLDRGTSRYRLTYDDRALQFLRTFVEATEKENYFEVPPSEQWQFLTDESDSQLTLPDTRTAEPYSFAFQPVVDPLAREVVSVEARMRGAQDTPLRELFAPLTSQEMHALDLRAKAQAFAQARRLGIEAMKLSVNLLPMALVEVPDAVDFLLREIQANGLIPQQITVEVTENEAISRTEDFEQAIKQLKAAGISLAIDNFGAGSAGLLLLTRVQPDRIKIDSNIIRDVHKSGPKQAVVQAILKCCSSLEIAVTAEGVEKAEEWMWLEAAGISTFQGPLFAAPVLHGITAVAWPEPR